MSRSDFRTEIDEAVKLFLPLLKALKFRDLEEETMVFLKKISELSFLNLDNYVITVIKVPMDQTSGLFFHRIGDDGIVTCFIILNSKMYETDDMEKVKVAAIHELTHIIAMIMIVTTTSIERQREIIRKRNENNQEELTINTIEAFMTSVEEGKAESDQFDHDHFCYDKADGVEFSYIKLFYNLMFSKKTFEDFFTEKEQDQFKRIYAKHMPESLNEAGLFYREIIEKAAKEKSVPFRIALRQAKSWFYGYLR